MQPGHVDVSVNSLTERFITVEEFGQTTSPVGDQFTTFLLSVDLSNFGIHVEAGQQYVVGIAHGNTFAGDGLYLRVIGSRATGFEDMYQECGRTSADSYCAFVSHLPGEAQRPGYLSSQLGIPFQQYAARVTLGNAEYTGDNAINAADYVMWRDRLGATVERGSGADGNGSGMIDIADYELWQRMFGMEEGMGANVQVPEPSAWGLVFVFALWGAIRRGLDSSAARKLIESPCLALKSL